LLHNLKSPLASLVPDAVRVVLMVNNLGIVKAISLCAGALDGQERIGRS
jgi:hypothetical protein